MPSGIGERRPDQAEESFLVRGGARLEPADPSGFVGQQWIAPLLQDIDDPTVEFAIAVAIALRHAEAGIGYPGVAVLDRAAGEPGAVVVAGLLETAETQGDACAPQQRGRIGWFHLAEQVEVTSGRANLHRGDAGLGLAQSPVEDPVPRRLPARPPG